MKKLITVLVGLGLIAALVYFLKRSGSEGVSSSSSVVSIEPPKADDEALYTVKIIAKQKLGDEETTLVDMNGTLSQIKQGEGEFVSRWAEISLLNLKGQAADTTMIASLINKPIITTIAGEDVTHYLPNDFPQDLKTFQLSFLQKLFVNVKPVLGQPIDRRERDEVGTSRVTYLFERQGSNFRAVRTWAQYAQDSIKVDATDNQLVYGLSPDGRLLSVEGTLSLHYRKPSISHFTTYISVKLNGSRAKPTAVATKVMKEDLKKTDIAMAVAEAQQEQHPGGLTHEEALQKLDAVNDKTDGKDVYDIFSALKADVIANPEHADALVSRIMATKERDESAQRRLSTLFGALAQSESPEIANKLADLATECPDNFCKVQALVGLNDHPQPTAASATKMMEIARQSPDEEIASTAILAAGSIGNKIDLPDLPKQLIAELNDPSKAEIKTAAIAAMGNHGSGEYFAVLESNINAVGTDSNLKGAAVYSLRYLPNKEVNGLLINVIQKEEDKGVASEALKAMQYRNLTGEQYLTVAKKSATFPDKELQQTAARMLAEAYSDNPKLVETALKTLRDQTKEAEVKAYIDGELNPQVPEAPSANP